MIVSLLPIVKPIDIETGDWSDEWRNFYEQQQILMQQSLSDEGFLIPSVSASDMAILENSETILPGTLVFNSEEVNGGSSDAPNGQLFVKLNDGLFHAVTNT